MGRADKHLEDKGNCRLCGLNGWLGFVGFALFRSWGKAMSGLLQIQCADYFMESVADGVKFFAGLLEESAGLFEFLLQRLDDIVDEDVGSFTGVGEVESGDFGAFAAVVESEGEEVEQGVAHGFYGGFHGCFRW